MSNDQEFRQRRFLRNRRGRRPHNNNGNHFSNGHREQRDPFADLDLSIPEDKRLWIGISGLPGSGENRPSPKPLAT